MKFVQLNVSNFATSGNLSDGKKLKAILKVQGEQLTAQNSAASTKMGIFLL
jgi:hypothetical protein